MKVAVMFKDNSSKLVCMFAKQYNSVREAKEAMLADANNFAHMHDGKLINPRDTDHFEVNGTDGRSCVWQYFKLS